MTGGAPAGLPADVGVCFKPQHLDPILAGPQPVTFFEVHAENYMGDGGPRHAQLAALHDRYALSVHGVGLSIGSSELLDREHLARLVRVCERHSPESVSEHLAWSTHDGIFFNDLLPLPYIQETLDRVALHVDQVQSALGRKILIENPATYLRFAESEIAETDFLAEVATRTGCGLLLDVNNVYVSSHNHGADPEAYLDSFPLDRVRQIHLAGHDVTDDEEGHRLLIDSHNARVIGQVWDLYARVVRTVGALPTLIEWDNDIPEWPVLLAEAAAARPVLQTAGAGRAAVAE